MGNGGGGTSFDYHIETGSGTVEIRPQEHVVHVGDTIKWHVRNRGDQARIIFPYPLPVDFQGDVENDVARFDEPAEAIASIQGTHMHSAVVLPGESLLKTAMAVLIIGP